MRKNLVPVVLGLMCLGLLTSCNGDYHDVESNSICGDKQLTSAALIGEGMFSQEGGTAFYECGQSGFDFSLKRDLVSLQRANFASKNILSGADNSWKIIKETVAGKQQDKRNGGWEPIFGLNIISKSGDKITRLDFVNWNEAIKYPKGISDSGNKERIH